MKKFLTTYAKVFIIPSIVIVGIIFYAISTYFGWSQNFRNYLILAVIIIGSFQLFSDTLHSLLERNFALDYIAIVAIVLGVVTHEYIAAAIIVLMLAGGNALEKFADAKAKSSLQKLKERIPNVITIIEGKISKVIDIAKVKINNIVLVRKGEVIGLDGILQSDVAVVDESSLTGEAYPIEKLKNDFVRSGTVNIGDVIEIKVSKESSESTYKKITDLVLQAQNQKTDFTRLADKFSLWFTLVTFAIALATYLLVGDWARVLAVLVIATPCPLILATPVALIGGVNSASRRNIICKNLSVLEMVDKCKNIVFDKTGTLTLGTPKLSLIKVNDEISDEYSEDKVLQIVESIERNSLHPFAKSIVEELHTKGLARLSATNISEKIGHGIRGEVDGKIYEISKSSDLERSAIILSSEGMNIAELVFDDIVKEDAKTVFQKLKDSNFRFTILSGDSKKRVEETIKKIGIDIEFKSDISPEGKLEFIKNQQNKNERVMMVGDGINDAPALAMADVGIVYSHEEYTASAEAGDVILLKNDISSVKELIDISNRTMNIALQSIYIGLGLSIAGMILASFGFIVPVAGAIIQELIDVGVIFNSLRSSRV